MTAQASPIRPLQMAEPGDGPAHDATRPRGVGRRALNSLATAATVVVVMAAAAMVVVAVASRLSPDGQFTVFGHPVMTVVSGSMSPAIDTGDLVIDDPVTPATAGTLQVGQIISFRDALGGEKIITHRIVGLEQAGGAVAYRTKGDANASADTSLRRPADVIGVVHTTVPRGGYLLTALQRPMVLGLFLASIALAFAAGPLFRLARSDDRADQTGDREAAAP